MLIVNPFQLTLTYYIHRVNQALVQVTGAQGQLCAIEAAVINSSIPPNWPLLDHLKSRQSVIVIKVELVSQWQTHYLLCLTKIKKKDWDKDKDKDWDYE